MDIIANGTFGRDDGILCYECGDTTYLVFDDGYGLSVYRCDGCQEDTAVQGDYELPDGDPEDMIDWEELY